MCGCQHDDPDSCGRAKLAIGERFALCECACHRRQPIPDVARAPERPITDTKTAFVDVLKVLIETLENGTKPQLAILTESLLAVGNFAQHTKDQRATAALCYAAADAIRAARKVYSAVDEAV